MEEVWKIYKDNIGKGKRGSLWEISNFGNVRKNRQFYQPRIHNECYVFGPGWAVHIAVATLFVSKPESSEKLEVDHIDGNPLINNRADNLRWVTHKENMNNPISRKRLSIAHKGEKNSMYNKHHSEEAKTKMRKPKSEEHKEKLRGRHFYNNGVICVSAYECPEGFVPGMLKRKKG